MIFAFDVGNTETTVGLLDGDHVVTHWRLTTDTPRTPDELAMLLRQLIASAAETGPMAGTTAGEAADAVTDPTIRGVAICSVVPPVTGVLAEACFRSFGLTPTIVDASSPLPIRLEVDEPLSVGADRVVNTLAASRIYQRDTIVVDLGTATTYDCITADGAFLGGIIQPGVRTSAETLFRRAAKLSATELIPPTQIIGKRTEECIRAGVLFGAADSINGLVRRTKAAWPTGNVPYVIGTGGLAESLRPYCDELDHVDPYLTLRGLGIAHELLNGPSSS